MRSGGWSIARKSGKLDNEQKAFIVERLAVWESPSEVAKAVKAEFGTEISRQAIERYDPEKHAGRDLGARWRERFWRAREAFRRDLEAVPEVHKPVRVRRLAEMSRAAQARGNAVLAAALLEQIAKEVGNVYSNRRELTGTGGGPIDTKNSTEQLTDEQLDARLDVALGKLGYQRIASGNDAGPADGQR